MPRHHRSLPDAVHAVAVAPHTERPEGLEIGSCGKLLLKQIVSGFTGVSLDALSYWHNKETI
jgi:hypothetical protein